jgi:hypothetical protein
MKLELSIELKARKDVPLKDGEGNPITLHDAVVRSLENPEETTLNGEQKYRRYQLIKKLDRKPESDFSAEEVSLMKEAVGRFPWLPFVHGVICDLLDQKTAE